LFMWNEENVYVSSVRVNLHHEKGDTMSKESWEDDYEMKAEYDFSGSVPNPYAVRFREGANQIVLDPEVSAVFPDSRSVNDALRLLIRAAKSAQDLQKAS
jgi:hypothetical protein